MYNRATAALLWGLLLTFVPGLALAQQNGTVTGQVTDATTQETLPGANVVLTEIQLGGAADVDGEFTIEDVPPGSYTLRVTFVGYQAAEQDVQVDPGETVEVNVALDPDYANLEEVVVTGYSQQERQKLSTSISRVSGADLNATINNSPEEALQGKVAGVVLNTTTGQPGGGFQVRIRGATSVNASNQPLYVVDGVPVAQGQFTDGFTGQQTVNNVLSNLDLSNIESIEVLKDAAATAIYGTRASNGVVLITTKRGQVGQSSVNFNYSVGSTELNRTPDVVTGPQFARILREGFRNDCEVLLGIGSCTSEQEDIAEQILAGSQGTPSPDTVQTFDYVDAVTRIGMQHNANMTFSGGQSSAESTFRYLVSGNYRLEEGTFDQQQFQRLGGRANVNYNWADNRARVSASASYNQTENNVIENDNNIDGAFTNALLGPPYVPFFDENDPGGFNLESGAFTNPLSILEIKRQIVNTKFLGNAELAYDFTSNLTGRASVGLDRFDQNEEVFAPSFTREGAPRGSGENDVFTYTSYILDATLNYDNTFGQNHDVVVVGGTSFEKTLRERVEVVGDQFPSDQLQVLAAASNITGGSGTEKSATGLQSVFGSIDYAFDNRYLLKVTARADGSSRFGDENQWGFFPAASAGWNLHRESFLNPSWIDQLKLRVSAGITGQQAFGVSGDNQFTFPALDLFGTGSYAGNPSFAPAALANPGLQWETTTSYNLGLDFSVFRGRVSGSVDVYQKNTDDLLLNTPLPPSSGFGGFFQNVGEIQNQGIEAQLSTVNIRTDAFEWTTSVNASSNRNEVQSLAEGVNVIPTGFANIITEGEALGAFRGWVVDGIFQSQEEIDNHADQSPFTAPGDFRFEDINGDGVINADDRTIIGDPYPDLFGGITNNVRYRGLQLNVFLQYSLGNDVFNATDQFFAVPGFVFSTKEDILDRWTPENTGASEPRATLIDPNNNGRESTHFLEDGSYMRLKSVTLSYSLPSTLLNRVGGLRNARVYVTGKNLLTFTGYDGLDPEVNSFGQSGAGNVVQGNDFFTQPIPRFIQAGIEVGL
jgi:TonB-linked SusC/RagA family outer membrane protein